MLHDNRVTYPYVLHSRCEFREVIFCHEIVFELETFSPLEVIVVISRTPCCDEGCFKKGQPRLGRGFH